MINSKYRLNVSAGGQGFKSFFKGEFVAIKRKPNNISYSRIGVVIGKKYSKKAVARNRLKRDIFRFFAVNKQYLEKLPNPSDFIIVVLTTESQMKDNRETLLKELANVISL